jgi:hypothetical protein
MIFIIFYIFEIDINKIKKLNPKINPRFHNNNKKLIELN